MSAPCPLCETPGYHVDPENGAETCAKPTCVVNERACPGRCDGTGRIYEHHRLCNRGTCRPACPIERTCPVCHGHGVILASDLALMLELAW